MKFTASRELLLKPIQLVSGAVERKQTMAVLGNILLSSYENNLRLTATDLEIELVADSEIHLEQSGDITIPARKFLDICRSLPEQAEIQLSITDGKAVLKTKSSRFSLATLPANEFPALDDMSGGFSFEISQQALKHVIEQTAFAMAQQDVRYYLNGLLFELANSELRAVATDGHRLAMCVTPLAFDKAEPLQVIVPRKTIYELARLLEDNESLIKVQVTANHIRFYLNNLQITSKLIDGRFPDYQRVIPLGCDKTLLIDRQAIRQAMMRAAILSNEKYKGIRLNLSEAELSIQTHNPDQEEAEEKLLADYQGSELEVGFNVAYMLDALSVLKSEQVRMTFKDSNSSCLIENPQTGESKYVIMPMRL